MQSGVNENGQSRIEENLVLTSREETRRNGETRAYTCYVVTARCARFIALWNSSYCPDMATSGSLSGMPAVAAHESVTVIQV